MSPRNVINRTNVADWSEKVSAALVRKNNPLSILYRNSVGYCALGVIVNFITFVVNFVDPNTPQIFISIIGFSLCVYCTVKMMDMYGFWQCAVLDEELTKLKSL